MNSQIEDSEVMLEQQRSHILLVFSNAVYNKNEEFLEWYKTDCLQSIVGFDKVLSAQHYQENSFNISGNCKPIGFKYLALYQLCLDGSEDASLLIEKVSELHQREINAGEIATWLYYPVSENICQ